MTQIELAADAVQRSMGMLMMTLGDFSDGDFFVRPCPGANHATWQLGHLTTSEAWIVNAVKPGSNTAVSEEFAGKFSKETSSKDDVEFFPKKAAILEQLNKTRAVTVAWIKTLTPADLDKPGPERMVKMCPTVGHVLGLIGNHDMMHMGQLQVIRRKLGKPILF
jgi:uncharacterized damage-inducible protein DinB